MFKWFKRKPVIDPTLPLPEQLFLARWKHRQITKKEAAEQIDMLLALIGRSVSHREYCHWEKGSHKPRKGSLPAIELWIATTPRRAR